MPRSNAYGQPTRDITINDSKLRNEGRTKPREIDPHKVTMHQFAWVMRRGIILQRGWRQWEHRFQRQWQFRRSVMDCADGLGSWIERRGGRRQGRQTRKGPLSTKFLSCLRAQIVAHVKTNDTARS